MVSKRLTIMLCFQRPENEPDNEDDLQDNEDENVADPVESSGVNSASQDEQSHDTTGTTAVNKGKKRKAEMAGHVDKRMDEAYLFLKQVAAKPKVAKDQNYMFCELLCYKLRALDDDTREIAMHEIDNLMFHFKNARKQQPNMPFHHYYQKPGYFQSYVQQGHAMNQHQDQPVYVSGESSASYASPAHTPSTPSTPQQGLNDNQSEEHCPSVADLLRNFNTD